MITTEKRVFVQGLKSEDVKVFGDLLLKANIAQLNMMILNVNSELEKRGLYQ